ncbi:phospholipase D family protein [Bremerella alba]|uniref:Phospholipase D-like domain-containing protein n=1 Tax=Bremerella alba TaxID=980252 RepID=A0A7V9A7Y2_9BACT|nr:phospholipase D family protein [Bremerella alba]MBA2115847.1 hypothetical protein [Bremerella alba]
MAKFLNTSGITYHLEQLIKSTKERLVIISPYLRLSDKIRELIEDLDRLKIDIRLVYGKNDLHPRESAWLESLTFVRCSFCKNLHAKCYLNESEAIITSMNIYEFSQVNNNEMGIVFNRDDDPELFKDTYDEAQRLIRISDQVKISVELIEAEVVEDDPIAEANSLAKQISTSQLAKQLKRPSKALFSELQEKGWIARNDNNWELTDLGKQKGGEVKNSKRFGDYITWPQNVSLD